MNKDIYLDLTSAFSERPGCYGKPDTFNLHIKINDKVINVFNMFPNSFTNDWGNLCVNFSQDYFTTDFDTKRFDEEYAKQNTITKVKEKIIEKITSIYKYID